MQFLILVLLVFINGLLAMSEAAVIAARRTRLEQRAENGDTGARYALELSRHPNRFLSTVQIGITLIGIGAGAFGGAAVADDVAESLGKIELLEAHAEPLSVALVVLLTTYLSLIIGELVPKRLAIQRPETIASMVAAPMTLLSRLTYPLVWFLSFSTTAVLWLLRIRPDTEPEFTEEEITVMLREGHRAGIFERHEREMVEGVFMLDELPAAALMTPRTEMEWLDISDTQDEIRETLMTTEFSWYPVKDDSPDRIIGVVQARTLLTKLLRGEPIDLQALAFSPIYVPETLPGPNVLERLRGSRAKMAFVIGEHSGIEGVITVQDVIETVVGEIDTPQAIRREDGSWLIDGLMAVEEFKALFELKSLPDESLYRTMAGFVVNMLDDIPTTADRLQWETLSFEVMDMDGNRVDKILVTRSTTDQENPGDETAESPD